MLGGKELFKASLELRFGVSSNPTWIRDSTYIYYLEKNFWRNSPFLSKRKLRLKRKILFWSKRNPLLFKRILRFKRKKTYHGSRRDQ